MTAHAEDRRRELRTPIEAAAQWTMIIVTPQSDGDGEGDDGGGRSPRIFGRPTDVSAMGLGAVVEAAMPPIEPLTRVSLTLRRPGKPNVHARAQVVYRFEREDETQYGFRLEDPGMFAVDIGAGG